MGWKVQHSFYNRLRSEGYLDEVKAKLGAPEADPIEAPVDDPGRLETQRLKDENKALRRDNREYAKRLASEEDFFNRIVEATRVPVKAPNYKTRKQSQGKPANSVVLPIFDCQFGQFVRPTDTPGNRGAFSAEIFDQRLARWVEAAKEIIEDRATAYRIDELIVALGGDQVEGDEIFGEQAWQLELDPPRQVWELSCKLDSALRELTRWAKEDVGIPWLALYGVDDNHGVVGGKRKSARPKTYSWNWLLQKILYDKLRKEPINQFVSEPGGALFFYCAGHEFQLIHGHQIRGWGGLPFYGLTRFDGKSIRMHNRIYRYLLMGHHHQAALVPNGAGETIVSGDWVGPNNLSGALTAGSRPQQNVIFVAHKWGLAGMEKIYFAEAQDAYAQTEIHGQELVAA